MQMLEVALLGGAGVALCAGLAWVMDGVAQVLFGAGQLESTSLGNKATWKA